MSTAGSEGDGNDEVAQQLLSCLHCEAVQQLLSFLHFEVPQQFLSLLHPETAIIATAQSDREILRSIMFSFVL